MAATAADVVWVSPDEAREARRIATALERQGLPVPEGIRVITEALSREDPAPHLPLR